MNIWNSIKRASLLGLIIFTSGCREQIVHDLGESDANRLLTKLQVIQIDAKKIKQPDGKWAIAVSNSDSYKALKHLEDTRLLRDSGSSNLESKGMISSREDQRFRVERALSREIEATLASIPGVFEARVHLNLPPADPLFGQRLSNAAGSASVLLVAGKEFSLAQSDIAHLVAGAAGIDSKGISVLLSRAVTDEVRPDISAELAPSQDYPGAAEPVQISPNVIPDSGIGWKQLRSPLGIPWLGWCVFIAGLGLLIFSFYFKRRDWRPLKPIQTASTEA